MHGAAIPTFSDICAMPILLVAATSVELAPFEAIRNEAIDTSKMEIYTLITGVGALACSQSLQDSIQQNRPDLMIQIGIAGSFDPSETLGTAMLVSRDRMGDIGVIEEGTFKDLYDLRLADPNEKPYTQGFLNNPMIEHPDLSSYRSCTGITVNEITTDSTRISLYRNKYQAEIETMEGAAFHYVALKNQIPFLQIRGISNHVGERNKKNWHIATALENAYSILEAFLKK